MLRIAWALFGLACLVVFLAVAVPLALACDRHGLQRLREDIRPGPGEEWL